MIILDHEQGSPEWLAARRGVATASNFGRIITPAKGDYSAQATGYMAELIDAEIHPEHNNDFEGNEWTEHGKQLEAQARRYFASSRGVKLRETGLILADDRSMGASPDSIFCDTDGKWAGLEIKCPAGWTHVEWVHDELLPVKHKPQVHGGMAVTAFDRWYFMSYCPGYEPLIIRVDRNSYTAAVESTLKVFNANLAKLRKKVVLTQEDF